jgi:hypothetical protein
MNFNDNDSINEHETNLAHGMSMDKINKRMDSETSKDFDMEKVLKNVGKLKLTDTDMVVGMISNPSKLVNEKVEFEKPSKSHHEHKNNYEQYNDSKSKSEIDEFIDKVDNNINKDLKFGASETRTNNNNNNNNNSESNDELIEKLELMKQMYDLQQRGVKFSRNYGMTDDIKMMKYEYELHKGIIDKKNTLSWLSDCLVNICYGIELGNDKVDPFGFKLKGWSDCVKSEKDKYVEVLGELYEKYFKGSKSAPPEIKMMLMILGSAISFHIAQSMVNSMPNLVDMLKNDPNLAKNLHDNAVNDNINNNEHDQVRQKMNDLDMLRNAREKLHAPHDVNKQLAEKDIEIQQLQNQLNMVRSDSRSSYIQTTQKTMKPPQIPNSIKDKYNNMQYELLRQQQILDHKQKMKETNMNDTPSYDGKSQININKNIDNIINKQNKIDIDNISKNSNVSQKSRTSKGSKGKRKKPAQIKISTGLVAN